MIQQAPARMIACKRLTVVLIKPGPSVISLIVTAGFKGSQNCRSGRLPLF